MLASPIFQKSSNDPWFCLHKIQRNHTACRIPSLCISVERILNSSYSHESIPRVKSCLRTFYFVIINLKYS